MLLSELAGTPGAALGLVFKTWIGRVALGRVGLAGIVAALAARQARRLGGRLESLGLIAAVMAFVASSALVSHAASRATNSLLFVTLDAVHYVAVATWVGGLAYFVLYAVPLGRVSGAQLRAVARRFSSVAVSSVAVLVTTGFALGVFYVGTPGGLVGTTYGWLLASKIVLLIGALAVAYTNFRTVHHASAGSDERLCRYVEVELGLGVTVLFVAASLASLPLAVQLQADRATPSEVAADFVPAWPRLTSPPIQELLRTADPLFAPPGDRKPVARAGSEYNHHWAGLFVVMLAACAAFEGLGVRIARHWPLVFFGLAAFLFMRGDPKAWPLGPAGFWQSMSLADVLQHRLFVILVVGFGVFEWMVRTGRLPLRPWGYAFPLICAVGGGLLLVHSHGMADIKTEFLADAPHIPIGILGVFAGWARWLEVRWPESGRMPSWVWRLCFVGIGLLLLDYREI